LLENVGDLRRVAGIGSAFDAHALVKWVHPDMGGCVYRFASSSAIFHASHEGHATVVIHVHQRCPV